MRNYEEFELSNNFCYEKKMEEKTNQTLLSNVKKTFAWIKENCPNLNGTFECRHHPYHWVRLVVENGKSYLEEGSHGWDFDVAMSDTETAVFSRGSMQEKPYSFPQHFFFQNNYMEEFLSQWGDIKECVKLKNQVQTSVFSEDFEA